MFNRTKKRLKQYIKERAVVIADYKMFTLSSGEKTDTYVDMRIVTHQSDALKLIGKLIYDKIKGTAIDSIGGPAMGAIPIVSAVLSEAGNLGDQLNGFYVRKSVKTHGTQKHIEGAFQNGDVVWLVDDVITTGASLIRTINVLRRYDCEIIGATTLLARDIGLYKTMQIEHNVDFSSLFYLDEILDKM